jgi:hypothetical protein
MGGGLTTCDPPDQSPGQNGAERNVTGAPGQVRARERGVHVRSNTMNPRLAWGLSRRFTANGLSGGRWNGAFVAYRIGQEFFRAFDRRATVAMTRARPPPTLRRNTATTPSKVGTTFLATLSPMAIADPAGAVPAAFTP